MDAALRAAVDAWRADDPDPATVAELDAPPPAGAEQDPSDEDIRVRAYFRYLERGGTHGASFDDWAEAKKELKQKR